jgi:hypothetical protein
MNKRMSPAEYPMGPLGLLAGLPGTARSRVGQRAVIPLRYQREFYRALGVVLWQLCEDYGVDPGSSRWNFYLKLADPQFLVVIEDAVAKLRLRYPEDRMLADCQPAFVQHGIQQSLQKLDALVRLLMLPEWVEAGLPVVEVSHSLAASMLVTNVSKSVLEDVELPFPIFEIVLPHRMFWTEVDGELYDLGFLHAGKILGPFWEGAKRPENIVQTLSYCLVAQAEPCSLWTVKKRFYELGDIDGECSDAGALYTSTKSEAASREVAERFAMPVVDIDGRTVEALGRLLANVVLLMTNAADPAHVKRVGKSHQRWRPLPAGRNRVCPIPTTRIFRLVTPVRHDFRGLVSEYLKTGTGGGLKSVQSIVAGHWKMQVHGPQRSARKRIFVEPYWRGPEDAPIALRPHKLL